MVLSNLSKLNIFILIILSTQPLAETAINHLANNLGGTKEIFLPEIPQAYYIPYQKYILPLGQKYVSPPENKIPITETSTEKSIPSAPYRISLDNPKYATSQLVKPSPVTPNTQVNYPYLYTVAEVRPSTTARYPTLSSTRSDLFEMDPHYTESLQSLKRRRTTEQNVTQKEETILEVPKKYQYGYRVSNPHTGAEFGHSEVNDGISARGYYHVLLPDGRLQNVKYWAGPSGYHAIITYENQY